MLVRQPLGVREEQARLLEDAVASAREEQGLQREVVDVLLMNQARGMAA
jgi:hypothetical protein